MPQLSIETFVSQYFWFISILLAFYYISITLVIPRISEIFKTRKKCINISSSRSEDTLQSEETNIISSEASLLHSESSTYNMNAANNIMKNYGFNSLPLLSVNQLSLIQNNINDKNAALRKVGETWVKKFI